MDDIAMVTRMAMMAKSDDYEKLWRENLIWGIDPIHLIDWSDPKPKPNKKLLLL